MHPICLLGISLSTPSGLICDSRWARYDSLRVLMRMNVSQSNMVPSVWKSQLETEELGRAHVVHEGHLSGVLGAQIRAGIFQY